MTAPRVPDARDEGGDPACWAHLFDDADADDADADDTVADETVAATGTTEPYQSSSTSDPKPSPQ